MNKLATVLANRIRSQVSAAYSPSGQREVRLGFLGPPLELMSAVLDDLVAHSPGTSYADLPFLLQVPREDLRNGNPAVEKSGWCEESHVLDVRNRNGSASYVVLVPTGEHSMKSIGDTTDKFGVAEGNNGVNATFETWWEDSFIQDLVLQAISETDLPAALRDDAKQIVEAAARAADEAQRDLSPRVGAWRLLSRLFSIDAATGLTPSLAICLACGVPPMRADTLDAKLQLGTLKGVAEAMSEGFRRCVDRLSDGASDDEKEHLGGFLDHVRSTCEVTTMFERATPAYYCPGGQLGLPKAPLWWLALDVEKWTEFLAEEPSQSGDIVMTCTNSLANLGKSMPAVVSGPVQLQFETKGGDPSHAAIEVSRTPVGKGGNVGSVAADGGELLTDENPPPHKQLLTYRASAAGFKPGSMKAVSLATWQPGIFVACRHARKFSPPRKPAKRAGKGGTDWEASLSLPGPGRYELLVFVSPGVTLEEQVQVSADQDDNAGASSSVTLRQATPEMYRVEIEADGNCQIDLNFSRPTKAGKVSSEAFRTYLTCEDIPEVGCRSEFERLIKVNRRHLENFDSKTVITVNRSVRSTMLQDWILSNESVRTSYQPIVLAEDYDEHWSPPAWGKGRGPILSLGSFIQDPRPAPEEFNPPVDFLDAREEIAKRVRGDGDQSGVFETARLGEWVLRDEQFASLVEKYVDAYQAWLVSDPEIACWSDVVAICSLDASKRSLNRAPIAIMLSPLHPLRVGWHAVAQGILAEADEAGKPCPAASVLDPDCVPDILSLYLRSPAGLDQVDYLSVENGTDYWSVLWHGRELEKLPERSLTAPFGEDFGINIGGISVGFSAAQVKRALDDVSDLLSAKPVVAVAISSAGGTTDACNQGLVEWCTARFQEDEKKTSARAVGRRFVEVFDDRPKSARPDDATIANLSEDTGNSVRWFDGQPEGAVPDLGIVAQLDMSEPRSERVDGKTPLSVGGMLRHRVRRQLPGAFLAETRQSITSVPSGEILSDKVAALLSALENLATLRTGLQFAPNVHEIQHMLRKRQTDFVAVSSAAIDPACFLGGWLEEAYLWDFDLPSYSQRAGDTNGYYLLSQVTEADRDALSQALARLPGCGELAPEKVNDILLEVARRGIPTIKGLAGDDAGATGDLGVFVAARLLQDRFRGSQHVGDGLLPVIEGAADDAKIAIIVPVDPFRGYFGDLYKSLGKEKGDLTQLRPDVVVFGIDLSGGKVRIKVTPIEVKCRPTSRFSAADAVDALEQAKALSSLLCAMQRNDDQPRLWSLAYQHLLLSIIGFGLRVYSQHQDVVGHAARWSEFHERIARAILDGSDCVEVDKRGRLIILDDNPSSKQEDFDKDGFDETIIISRKDAALVVAEDPSPFYEMVRSRLGNWELMPNLSRKAATADVQKRVEVADREHSPNFVEGGDTNPNTIYRPADVVAAKPAAPATTNDDIACTEQMGTGVILEIGTTIDGFRPRDLTLNISDTRLNQLNIGVVGDLGTGKTQLLKSLIAQIALSAPQNRGHQPSFLIFDYKRDYSSDDFVRATNARVVRPEHLPLNLFDTSNMENVSAPWLQRYRFFADVLDKIYSGIGNVQRNKLKEAIKAAYASCPPGRPPTLYDIRTFYSEMVEGRADSILSIVGDLVDMEVFASSVDETIPFNQFLDGVVVISLDALGQDDRSKNMLVAIMLNLFYENMLKTTKRPFLGTEPQLRAIDSYLLVDEADNIMKFEFDVLRKLLLQGREFGTGIILASQYLRHFKVGSTDYRDPLLTWFIHKVPNVTAQELSALGLTNSQADLAERIKTLKNHQCLYKSFDVQGEIVRGLPFFELMSRAK
jgi:DNA phosphorothioation-dependent restriction protein DptH